MHDFTVDMVEEGCSGMPHDAVVQNDQWGLCEYVIVHTILGGSPVILWISLGGSPVILWISLGGKPKRLPLIFGYHDVMCTSPIYTGQYETQGQTKPISIRKIKKKRTRQ